MRAALCALCLRNPHGTRGNKVGSTATSAAMKTTDSSNDATIVTGPSPWRWCFLKNEVFSKMLELLGEVYYSEIRKVVNTWMEQKRKSLKAGRKQRG